MIIRLFSCPLWHFVPCTARYAHVRNCGAGPGHKLSHPPCCTPPIILPGCSALSVSLISIFFSVVHLRSLYLYIITLSHSVSLSVWFSPPQLSLLSYLVLNLLSHLRLVTFLYLCSHTNTPLKRSDNPVLT